MNRNRVIEAAIRAAQDFLWQNAPPMHYVVDPPFRVRAANHPAVVLRGGVLFGPAQRDRAAKLGKEL